MSFCFYDLETFGLDPSTARIAQFAAVRTDDDLNLSGEPCSFFVRPAGDVLPSPVACAITLADPYHHRREGIPECEAMGRIIEMMEMPGTCTLGYNNYGFDDPFVRHGFYRNFLPIYEREYKNGNSRWDLYPVLRAAKALRPDGIEWPLNEQGVASFKLEDLAIANHVRSGDAHEALSDVLATLGMARLLKRAQPKFWNYVYSLRRKQEVLAVLNLAQAEPLLHVGDFYPAAQHKASLVLPLFTMPDPNRVLLFDLRFDPQALLDLSAEQIREWQFSKGGERQRTGIQSIRINESPMLFAWRHVDAATRERLQLTDDAECLRRAALLRRHLATLRPRLTAALDIPYPEASERDVDLRMMEGFFQNGDQRWMRQIRSSAPASWPQIKATGLDPRLPDLLFRYQARNFPQTLDETQRRCWHEYCAGRFEHGLSERDMTRAKFDSEMRDARTRFADQTEALHVLDQVQRFADEQIAASASN